MKNFIWEVRHYGLKIALDNLVISFTKWWLKAKRIQISYGRQKATRSTRK